MRGAGLTERKTTPVDMQRFTDSYVTTPSTPVEALMQQAPGEPLNESTIETWKRRDAVAACTEILEPVDRFTLDAFHTERWSHARIGRTIQRPVRTVGNQIERIEKTLAKYISAQPSVIERITMLQPERWEHAASQAIRFLQVLSVDDNIRTPDEIENDLEACVRLGAGADAYTSFLTELAAWAIKELAAEAVADSDDKARTYEAACQNMHDAILPVLCDRQRKYGHGNIMKFGPLGIAVRVCDKTARIANGDGDFDDESFVDSFIDIIGYGCIAHMLDQDTFLLDLGDGTPADPF